MKSVFIFISLLIMLCPAFSQSRMEHYLDSLGLVNVGRMDPTLKIDLMYTRADNFTGKVLYLYHTIFGYHYKGGTGRV